MLVILPAIFSKKESSVLGLSQQQTPVASEDPRSDDEACLWSATIHQDVEEKLDSRKMLDTCQRGDDGDFCRAQPYRGFLTYPTVYPFVDFDFFTGSSTPGKKLE